MNLPTSNKGRTSDFDYELPPELIAQHPASERTLSRLMVIDRSTGSIRHDGFSNIRSYLDPGDLLVANRSRVLPARILGHKETGGSVEILLVNAVTSDTWIAMARPSRRLHPGTSISFPGTTLVATVQDRAESGRWLLTFSGHKDVTDELRRIGELPLPPYIHSVDTPPDRYQTVYADREGSIAAPTAGLHFSRDLIGELRRKGVNLSFVTLHVGPGTFRPVTVEKISEHRMDAEWGEIPLEVADSVNRTHDAGKRVVAVGTTTTRLLETVAAGRRLEAFSGRTDLFIRPGYHFQVVDALVTNFHLPRSTLLMLVTAFLGRELMRTAYAEAIDLGYRFYSFGDAMLIL